MTTAAEQHWLIASWRGDLPLSRLFWRYAVPINLVFFVVGAAVGYFSNLYPQVIYAVFLAGPLLVIFTVWLCVSLWRCAYNTSRVVWTYLARAWAVLVAYGLVVQLRRVVEIWM